ncbi:zinc finger protein [Mactra antiquata]
MVHRVKRRQANVQRVQQLLSGIAYIRSQKQISNIDRLARYMEREHEVKKSEAERQLHYAVLDNLILSYSGVGFKGSMTGIEYEGFRIPEEGEIEHEDDGHDWYCFECHLPGEMYACSDCWRVFHPDCQDEDADDVNYTCAVCKSARKKKKTKRKLLNTLLSYTIVRLKEKTRELHRIGQREEEKKYMPLFVYKSMDLNKMEQKVMVHKYKCIEEFLADAHNILHNMVLIYGDEPGGMTELAKLMIRDCKYDIDEMGQCQNCYYMSNAKPPDWFAQPCDPPHELVYAKLKGYSYWPAKVIHYMHGDKYDVRFFGGLHQRAVVPKDQIKPVDTDLKKLSIKRTAGFTKAEKELAVHRKLLQDFLRDKNATEEEDEEEEISTPNIKSKKTKVPVKEEDSEVSKPKKRKRQKEEDDEHDVPEERETVSSSSYSPKSKKSKIKKMPPPDDVVTSTEEYQIPKKRPTTNTTATQTVKKYTSAPTTVSSTQTDDIQIQPTSVTTSSTSQTIESEDTTESVDNSKPEDLPVLEPSEPISVQKTCNCDAKLTIQLNEQKENLEKEYSEEKEKALDELSQRLHKDFEEDKQQAVSRAMGKLQTELDRVRRQTEDKCKEQYKDEMKKLAQKHKEAISTTKKKQWCYNCEEEAMYHCCWNTSYCSVKCQQEHWHKEHKRVCRRKR